MRKCERIMFSGDILNMQKHCFCADWKFELNVEEFTDEQNDMLEDIFDVTRDL